MVGIVTLTCFGAVLFATFNVYRNLRNNIAKAEKTGLPYVLGPFVPIGYGYLIIAEIFGPLLRKIPIINQWGWLYLIDRQVSWSAPRVAENKYGDTYLIVTPSLIYLKTSSAELGSQVTSRKTDFLKPVERYKIVNLFGKSILTQEGQEWKRHKKIVGPSFSEKSNRMVFEESLRQTEGMVGLWASQQKELEGKGGGLKVEDTAVDAATLSLHVICAAGFGVPQLWPNEGEEKLVGNGVQGFSELDAKGMHTLTFKEGLNQLLKKLMWFVIFPQSFLKISPFKTHQSAYEAFSECFTYFHELLEVKRKQMYLGESDKSSMDLLGPMIKANEVSTTKSQQAPTLTTAEILGNCFIFLFAGHETTANNIHYSILEMALNPKIQRHLQEDIDGILGKDKPISEWSYLEDMPRLYNSMVGATMSESLRLIPAILNIPKVASGDQIVTIDGRQFSIPADTFVHLNVVGTNRNPRYWGEDPEVFRPERWLPKSGNGVVKENGNGVVKEKVVADGLEKASFESSNSGTLVAPTKGSYISFSEGARACPGRRFAQVESTAVLSKLFYDYSVELDVSNFASEEQLAKLDSRGKREVYEKARRRAENVIGRSEQIITLQMRAGDYVPVVFRRRGEERFLGLYT